MPYTRSTLLTRNLGEVFGENDGASHLVGISTRMRIRHPDSAQEVVVGVGSAHDADADASVGDAERREIERCRLTLQVERGEQIELVVAAARALAWCAIRRGR
jgi:hypothetical protein